MWAIFDVVRITSLTLISCISSPKKFPQRSWLSEFTFRLAKRLLQESVGKPIPWLRTRQKILKLYSPDLLKTAKQKEQIAGVPCLAFVPKKIANPDTVIIYFHGGGYVVGSADGYSSTLAKIALVAKAKVVGLEYRLSPEHGMPAAQEDCLAVTQYLITQHKDKKVILMGDSAGGGLCLATLNSLGNIGLLSRISAAVLISPWLTPADSNTLELAHEASDILDHSVLGHWFNSFNTGLAQHKRLFDFTNINVNALPPLYIQAAGAEVFSKQIQCLVEKLEQAGNAYQYDLFEKQFHVFQTFAPLVREADEALERIGKYVMGIASRVE